MAMTMPVQVGGDSMEFVLPKANAERPPTPKSATVEIAEIAERFVAVKPFPGVVTDEEVERQKDVLLRTLEESGTITPVLGAQVSTLQYNSPLTLPWRRRNELAVVVTLAEPEVDAEVQAAEEAEEAAAAAAAAKQHEDDEAAALQSLFSEYAARSEGLRKSFEERRQKLQEERNVPRAPRRTTPVLEADPEGVPPARTPLREVAGDVEDEEAAAVVSEAQADSVEWPTADGAVSSWYDAGLRLQRGCGYPVS